MLRPMVPPGMLVQFRRFRIQTRRRRNAALGLAEVFSRIYANAEWGGLPGQFWSGSGSVEANSASYVDALAAFMRREGVRRLVDCGCGDFRVGARIVAATGGEVEYIGIDIVPELIERNRREFGSDRIRFECRDICTDDLPDGDLCTIRQVMQHLENAQIGILRRLDRFPSVLITEHYPAPGNFRAHNLDKTNGSCTRVFDGSGVYLDRPPFALPSVELFHEVQLRRDASVSADIPTGEAETLRTWLVRPQGAPNPADGRGRCADGRPTGDDRLRPHLERFNRRSARRGP